MNIDEAVKVLNEDGYGMVDDWRAIHHGEGDTGVKEARSERFPDAAHLDEYTAIAIAEKLERDAGRDMPATRALVSSLAAAFDHISKIRGRELDQEAILIDRDDVAAAVAEWEPRS